MKDEKNYDILEELRANCSGKALVLVEQQQNLDLTRRGGQCALQASSTNSIIGCETITYCDPSVESCWFLIWKNDLGFPGDPLDGLLPQ